MPLNQNELGPRYRLMCLARKLRAIDREHDPRVYPMSQRVQTPDEAKLQADQEGRAEALCCEALAIAAETQARWHRTPDATLLADFIEGWDDFRNAQIVVDRRVSGSPIDDALCRVASYLRTQLAAVRDQEELDAEAEAA